MNIVAVAVSAQVKVCAFGTAEENPSDAGFLAAVADDVLVFDANLSVVDDD